MTKLHEVLATEPDLEVVAKKMIAEGTKTFERSQMFIGFEKVWEMFDENEQGQAPPPEHQEMATTVEEKLQYVCERIGEYYDSVLTKEVANQTARADLVVEGGLLLADAPATFLLGLENKLKSLRGLYEKLPTLTLGMEWKPAPEIGEGVWRLAHDEVRFKSAKTFKHKVLVPAQFPKEGEGGTSLPAQIERWEETVNVGQSVKKAWAGMISSAKKAAILKRLDEVIRATKKARQRANDIEIDKRKFADMLFKYING